MFKINLKLSIFSAIVRKSFVFFFLDRFYSIVTSAVLFLNSNKMQRVNPNQCQGHEKTRICHTFKNMVRWVAKILFVIISTIRNDLSLRISVLFLPSIHTDAKSQFLFKKSTLLKSTLTLNLNFPAKNGII